MISTDISITLQILNIQSASNDIIAFCNTARRSVQAMCGYFCPARISITFDISCCRYHVPVVLFSC